jgi:excisionase family DNA binding protein
MTDLRSLLSEALLAELGRLVDERVAAALVTLQPAPTTPWLSVADAARYLGVSERTVTRLLGRARIRSTQLGRRRLLHRDDLDLYLRERG